MAALILPSRRVAQPQGPVEVDRGNPLCTALGFHVSDFTGRDVVGQRFVTRSASLAYGTTALGRGFSSAADAAFSAPLDLSGTSEITVAFILKRNTATGTQVLVEHTINQNNQAGSFLIYTDTTNFLASISNGLGGAGNFNVVSCAAPAVGRTTKVVVTLARRGTSAQACRIWYDGVEQVTTQPNTGSISGAFANSTTYFFGRAATSLFANGVIHDTSIWLRSLADAEVAQWSANPWQLFRPIQRRILVPVAGGGGISQTVAFTLEDVSASVSQNLSHAQSLTGTLDDVTVSISQTAQHDQALAITLDDVVVSIAQRGRLDVELLGGGPGLPKRKKRTELDKDSYLYRLLSPDQRERIEPEAAEVIEEQAAEVVQAQAKPSIKAVRDAFKDHQIAYREAYREIYLELVKEMRQAQEDEEEEAIAMALIL